MTGKAGGGCKISQGRTQGGVTVVIHANDGGAEAAGRIIVAQGAGILMHSGNNALAPVTVAVVAGPGKGGFCVAARFKALGCIMAGGAPGGAVMGIEQAVLGPVGGLGMADLTDAGRGCLLIGKTADSIQGVRIKELNWSWIGSSRRRVGDCNPGFN